MTTPESPNVVLLMGVAGAGKTTIGLLLAQDLHIRFVDADDLHPPVNIAKMRSGSPLDDADRAPWLHALGTAIDGWIQSGERVVLACSALKAAYRAELVRDPSRVAVFYLKLTPELAKSRVAHRSGHFMKDDLIDSQFEALEEPRRAIEIDASLPPTEIVRQIRAALGR
jgi:gluconokinase